MYSTQWSGRGSSLQCPIEFRSTMNVDRTSSNPWKYIDPMQVVSTNLAAARAFFHCNLSATLQNCSQPSCRSVPYVWEPSLRNNSRLSHFPELQIVCSETDWALGANSESVFLLHCVNRNEFSYLNSVWNFIQFNSIFMCIIRATGALYPYFNHSIFYTVFIVQFGFPATEPGVPYNITVRASTGVGKGEPVSIVVFTVQQGNADVMIRYKYCAAPNLSIQEWLIKRSISCVHSQKVCLVWPMFFWIGICST